MNDVLLNLFVPALVSFIVAWGTLRWEESRGRAILYSLCCRYLISIFNCLDFEQRKVKSDQLTKDQHMNELDAVLNELTTLSSSPVFAKFVTSFPQAPMVLVGLRRELTEHKTGPRFALNEGAIRLMLDTSAWCKRGPWGMRLSLRGSQEHSCENLRAIICQFLQAANVGPSDSENATL